MEYGKLLGSLFGDEITDLDEETFDLFAQDLPSQNLGFVDAKASSIDLTIAGRDLIIHQSPSVLSSSRAGGTTGAVVWKVTPLFAEWLGTTQNPLFTSGILSAQSSVLELGCGISAIIGLVVAPAVFRYVLTDQAYVARFVEQNLAENGHQTSASEPGRKAGKSRRARDAPTSGVAHELRFAALDWEQDQVTPALTGSSTVSSFDLVVACDCVYNEALIDPLVSTCVDVCGLRQSDDSGLEPVKPTVCVVAQQLRDSDIFQAWLERFAQSFYVWRVPDSLLAAGLRSSSGFVVHVGILKRSST